MDPHGRIFHRPRARATGGDSSRHPDDGLADKRPPLLDKLAVVAAAAAVAAVSSGSGGACWWLDGDATSCFCGEDAVPVAYADLPGPVRVPSHDGGRLPTELDTNSGVNSAVMRTSLPFSK